MHNKKTFNFYDQLVSFSEQKVSYNNIYLIFTNLANSLANQTEREFYNLFNSFNSFIKGEEALAEKIRGQAIDEAIKILVSLGVYELSETEFYNHFMSKHDSWDEDVNFITEKNAELASRSQQLDARRTARRQNRRQLTGYGSLESIREADGMNITTNIFHGMFNIASKGATELNHLNVKKKIFEDPNTVIQIGNAIYNTVMSAFYGLVEAIQAMDPNLIHNYSESEKRSSNAITENILKGRIPDDQFLPALAKAINFYPYNQEIYIIAQSLSDADGDMTDLSKFLGITIVSDETVSDTSSNIAPKDENTEHATTTQPASTAGNFVEILSNKENNFFAAPDLPIKKINNFISKSGSEIDIDSTLFYYDDTVFGKGDAGILITKDSLYLREPFNKAVSYPIKNIKAVYAKGSFMPAINIAFHDGESVSIGFTQSKKGLESICDAIRSLI